MALYIVYSLCAVMHFESFQFRGLFQWHLSPHLCHVSDLFASYVSPEDGPKVLW